MESIYSAAQVTSPSVTGRLLFLLIDLLGVACFSYIVAKRLVPLLCANPDPRFDRPLLRLGRVLKFWLAQWKQPRYLLAGVLHIVLFAGFLLLLVHSFSLAMIGVFDYFVLPGLSGRVVSVYNVLTDYTATLVFFSAVIAAIRRVAFKPARYAVPEQYGTDHMPEAIFILALIATL